MSETVLDLRGLTRADAYRELLSQTHLVLEGIDDQVAGMATIAALLHGGFGNLWTGFYRVVEEEKLLRIGPYQGTLGCLEIAFGKGVCGTAAAERRSIIVDDVSSFPGHITCDPRTQSEIVVPVFDGSGRLVAVLDIDSEQPAGFSEEDRRGLEQLVEWFRKAA